jgi:hypothetical protein
VYTRLVHIQHIQSKILIVLWNPETKDYIIVFEYAEGGNFNNYLHRKYSMFYWLNKIQILTDIIRGLNEMHRKQMVRDFIIGNILFKYIKYNTTWINWIMWRSW